MIQHKLKCKFVKEDTQEIGESTSLWSPFRPLHRVFMLFFATPNGAGHIGTVQTFEVYDVYSQKQTKIKKEREVTSCVFFC